MTTNDKQDEVPQRWVRQRPKSRPRKWLDGLRITIALRAFLCIMRGRPVLVNVHVGGERALVTLDEGSLMANCTFESAPCCRNTISCERCHGRAAVLVRGPTA